MDRTLAVPHFALGSTYGLLGRLEQSRLAFLRALELEPNHSGTMADPLVHLRYQWATRREPLLGPPRVAAVGERAGDAYHISVPLLLLRDDELSQRWLAHAERLSDLSRTQITAAAPEVYRGDIAGALARVRARAQKEAGDSEVRFVRNDLVVLAAADDAEALTEQMFGPRPTCQDCCCRNRAGCVTGFSCSDGAIFARED